MSKYDAQTQKITGTPTETWTFTITFITDSYGNKTEKTITFTVKSKSSQPSGGDPGKSWYE